MRQLCNLAYAQLLENRTEVQIAELEMLLTDPNEIAEKEKLMEEQNARAMRDLMNRMPPGAGLVVPLKRLPQPPPKTGEPK